ncbi:MAG: EVE domain-containing protein, partial [Terriglobia bacterium]
YALATVASDPYLNPNDPKKKFLVVDLKSGEHLPRPVPLKEVKRNRLLRKLRFLKRPRLPVSPLTHDEYNEILRMAGLIPMLPPL